MNARQIALTFGLLSALLCVPSNAFAAVPTYANVPYADLSERNILDIYVPKKAKGPRPAVVFIHGGGWSFGDKSMVAPYADDLLARGFIVVSINYRYTNQEVFPANIHDCKGVIRFLRANAAQYSINPDRIGVFGESAGAHLAALLATSHGNETLEGTVGGNLEHSSRIQACGDFYGPTDFFAWIGENPEAVGQLNVFFGFNVLQVYENKDDPAYADQVAIVNSANPITYVSPDDASFHIGHGDKDFTVPLSQSLLLQAALQAANVNVQLQIAPGAGHELPPSESVYLYDFMEQRLMTTPPLGDFNGDFAVNAGDLGFLLGAWGSTSSPADLNNDGLVGAADLGILLGNWTG